MTTDPRHDAILDRLDASRREFLKRVIAGTSFTVPLIASFSMDGLSVESAEAIHLSNVCSSVPPPYVGPTSFAASLYSQGQTGHHGQATFTVTGPHLTYRLTLSPGVTVAEAHLIIWDPVDSIIEHFAPFPYDNVVADLAAGNGKVKGVASGSPCSYDGMLQEMAAGHARVVVRTTDGEDIQGQVQLGRK